MDSTKTIVLFYVDKATRKEVLAVFPEDKQPGYQMYGCYQHIGQHGTASRQYLKDKCLMAVPAEYKNLKAELEGDTYGYDLDVRARWPHGM